MKEFKKREPECWSYRDDGVWSFNDSEEEAIVEFFEQEGYDSEVTKDTKVELFGIARCLLDEKFINGFINSRMHGALSELMDDLDEGLACDDHTTDISKEMEDAYKEFISYVLSNYEVTRYDIVEQKEVRVGDYLTQEEIDELNE